MSVSSENRWKLIQQLALLAYVHRGEESKDLYKAVVGAKLLKSIWSECIKKDDTKQLRAEAIWAVAEFLQKHPNATEQEIQEEVEKQISLFIQKIQ